MPYYGYEKIPTYELEVTQQTLDWITAKLRETEKHGGWLPAFIHESLHNARKVEEDNDNDND